MNIVSGSPLDARQNPLIYLVIVVLALIILAVLGILIVSKIIKKKHESPEYIQQQKKKPTTQAHVTLKRNFSILFDQKLKMNFYIVSFSFVSIFIKL